MITGKGNIICFAVAVFIRAASFNTHLIADFVKEAVTGILDRAFYGKTSVGVWIDPAPRRRFYFIIFAGVTIINSDIHPYLIAVVGFGLNSAAYVSETIRAGILSVDKGQMEAGRALGLSYGKTMRSVIIPQAAKSIIPPLGNEAITLVKDTSVALVIGVSEFFTAIRSIVAATYDVLTPYIFAAIVYFVTVLIMTFALNKLEKRLRRSDAR